MKFERDSKGKIVLRRRDGTLAKFDFTVDAKEALYHRLGPNGEQMYFLPDKEEEKYKDEPVEEAPQTKAEEIEQTIEEVKSGRRGRPRKEADTETAKENEDEE